MRVTVRPMAVLVCVGLLGPAGAVVAADVRDTLPVSSAQVFKSMLTAAENGDGQKMHKATELLAPLIAHVDQFAAVQVEQELQAAIAQPQGGRLVEAAQRLVVLSVQTLLQESCRLSERDRMTAKIKYAFAEYLALDPYVARQDFDASKDIKNAFRKAHAMAGVDATALSMACNDIGNTLDRIFALHRQTP